MKILMFANESGDDPYPLAELQVSLTNEEIMNSAEIRSYVEQKIGDDFCDGQIYGDYYIEDFTGLPVIADFNLGKDSSS